MKIAIIGASGHVGSQFSKVLGTNELILWSHKDLEILSKQAVERRIASTDADVIVNMAAFHNTDSCEDDPAKAFAVNAVGTHYVAKSCVKHNKKMVYASTDYVFGQDLKRKKPYVESNPVGPVNVYGCTKVAGEELVRATCADHLIIRTSNLFGGEVPDKIPSFPEMIAERARRKLSLKVIADQIMSPTYTHDLVEKTLELLRKNATGTFHIVNSGQCSWYDFAAKTLQLLKIDHPLQPMSGAGKLAGARRPLYSAITSERLAKFKIKPMRKWDEALKAFFQERRWI